MYTDIYDDAMWLINLVENLLSVSRLEEGRMNLRLSTELIDEVVAEALRHINRKKCGIPPACAQRRGVSFGPDGCQADRAGAHQYH